MLELLVGTIASGKSSYVRRRAEQGALIVNDDSLVLSVHGGLYGKYDKLNKPLYKQLESVIIFHGIASGKDVIIDRPNMSVSCRQKYIGLARSLDTPAIAITFPAVEAKEHARRRMQSDPRGGSFESWEHIAQHYLNQYQQPTLAEGLDNIMPIDVAYDMMESEQENPCRPSK